MVQPVKKEMLQFSVLTEFVSLNQFGWQRFGLICHLKKFLVLHRFKRSEMLLNT